MKTRYAFRFRQQLADSNMQAIAEEYKKNYAKVSSHIKTIESINMDQDYEIIYKPDNYPEYVDIVSNAQSSLTVFTASTWSNLKTLPPLALNLTPMVNVCFCSILLYLQELTQQPKNESIRQTLNVMLTQLTTTIFPQIYLIGILIKQLENCQTEFTDVAKELRAIVYMAVEDKTIDEYKIKELNQELEALKDEVEKCSNMLIASCATLIGGCIGMALIKKVPKKKNHKKGIRFLKSVIGTVSATVIVGSVTGIVLNSIEISNLNKLIDQHLEEIDDYSLDVLQLEQIANDFDHYADETVDVKSCLQQMQKVWSALYDDITAINQGIVAIENGETPTTEFTQEYWIAVTEEMKSLIADYTTFTENIKLFDVSGISGKNVELEVGMSQEETAAAMSAAEPVELIEYLIS